MSGVGRDVNADVLTTKFADCGEILDVDVKKSTSQALVHFANVSSVVVAIRAHDGESLLDTKLKLSFGPPVPSKCVWCAGFGDGTNEKVLHTDFKRYGKVQEVFIDRVRKHALVYFDQVRVC